MYPSEFLNFTTTAEGEEACRIVEGVSLEQQAANSIEVSWEASPTASQYAVLYTPLAEQNWVTVETSETSLVLDGLQPGAEYILVVGVYCNGHILWNEGQLFTNDGTVSTQDIASIQRTVKLYPNPTQGQFLLEYSSSEQEQLNYQLYTALGQLVLSGQFSHNGGQQQLRLDLANQPDGVYYLQLAGAEHHFKLSERIVKVNGQ